MDELTNAVVQGNIPRVEELVKNGANVNKVDEEGETPLIHATMLSNQKLVEILLKNGADPNIRDTSNESTALEWALSDSDTPIEIVKLLIEGGADINAKNPDGRTPLFLPVEYIINLEALELLLKSGANVNIQNDRGKTPLHYAAKYEDDQVDTAVRAIQLLLENGANINAQDSNGDTPLMDALKSDVAIVTFLLKQGASPNIRNKYGNTPLMTAAFEGYQDIVRTLLEHGANVSIRDDQGKSAIDKAFTPKIRGMLQKAAIDQELKYTSIQSEDISRKIQEYAVGKGKKKKGGKTFRRNRKSSTRVSRR